MIEKPRRRPGGKAAGAAARSWRATPNATGRECPDCGAPEIEQGFRHAPTCPMNAGVQAALDDDAQWFREHPWTDLRRRPITPAEAAEMRFALGETPGPRVTVIQLAPGLRSRRFTFGEPS